MNQSLYRCANCRTQFSRENFYRHQNIGKFDRSSHMPASCIILLLFFWFSEITCPECKSTYVIEIKESPRAQSIERVGQYLQQNSKFLENSEKRPLNDNSETQSSIGTLKFDFHLFRSTFVCVDFVDSRCSSGRLILWCVEKFYFFKQFYLLCTVKRVLSNYQISY